MSGDSPIDFMKVLSHLEHKEVSALSSNDKCHSCHYYFSHQCTFCEVHIKREIQTLQQRLRTAKDYFRPDKENKGGANNENS